jgi:Family of unknown function (DUF5636)
MPKIENADEKDVARFLYDNFAADKVTIPGDKAQHMLAYAKIAKFLSQPEEVGKVADEMSKGMGQLYRYQKDEQKLRGAFSQVLRDICPLYGFSYHVRILNGQLSHEEFCDGVRKKQLFRDVYTRPHGEFTHTIQWLLLAAHLGEQIPIPDLYVHSVDYKSAKKFNTGKGDNEIYLWNFLVDCFKGEENYETNVLCNTFRCPQILTGQLRKVMPTDSWLGEFLYQRRLKGLKGGKKVSQDSHYAKPREVTMSKDYTDRMIDDERVYRQVSTNVFEKEIVDEMVSGPPKLPGVPLRKQWH